MINDDTATRRTLAAEMVATKVQELYDASCMVFSGDEKGALDGILWLRHLLGKLEPVDVGIDGGDSFSGGMISGTKVEEITYVHIHQCRDFSIGVFCFPAGATIPLHDHPEMVVLSKVLYGSLKARAYDWVVPPNPHYKKRGLASLVVDDVIMDPSSPPTVLFPTSGGNMHTFKALTPCAILDILSPPYSDEEGRPSTYFTEIPIPCINGFAILEEKEVRVPEDLMVVGAPYVGPEIVLDDGELEDWDDEEEEDDNRFLSLHI